MGVAHGWIIDYLLLAHLVRRSVLVFSSSPFWGWVGRSWKSGGVGWVVAGTLLGPEGSGASLGFLWASSALVPGAPFFVGLVGGGVGGVPPVF